MSDVALPATHAFEVEPRHNEDRMAHVIALPLTIALSREQFGTLAQHVAEFLDERRDDGFLDVSGAAEFLGGCSHNAVYHLHQRGRIRGYRVGRRLLFDRRELREDVERDE